MNYRRTGRDPRKDTGLAARGQGVFLEGGVVSGIIGHGDVKEMC